MMRLAKLWDGYRKFWVQRSACKNKDTSIGADQWAGLNYDYGLEYK